MEKEMKEQKNKSKDETYMKPDDAELKKKLALLKKLNKNAVAISIHDMDSLEKVKKILNKISTEK